MPRASPEPGVVWMTSEALPACSCVRIVSPYLSLGVGLVVMVTPSCCAWYSLARVWYGLSRLFEVANVNVRAAVPGAGVAAGAGASGQDQGCGGGEGEETYEPRDATAGLSHGQPF